MRFTQIVAFQEEVKDMDSLVALDQYGQPWQRIWLFREPAHLQRYVWTKLSMEQYPAAQELNATEEHGPRTVEPGWDRV